MKNKNVLITCLLGGMMLMAGCSRMMDSTKEAFGVQKKDILVSRVQSARDAQMDAKEQFATALDEFRSVVGYKGTLLDEKYKTLKSQYDKCESRTRTVESRIEDVRRVAKSLFREWEDELDQYSSPALRKSSETKLEATRVKCDKMIAAMEKARDKIYPVLAAFRDQVLFIKHNLNAQAIASLEGELGVIEKEISLLIREMENSMAEADTFIRQMQILEI
ncbi:DUF2959 domain-containing protein [Anaerohalosphaeraceae bacterium U12dextr]